jgi:hypothetical protein
MATKNTDTTNNVCNDASNVNGTCSVTSLQDYHLDLREELDRSASSEDFSFWSSQQGSKPNSPNPRQWGNGYNQPKKVDRKKFRWHDGFDRQLTAGGILVYDDKGFWAVGETDKSGNVYTDFGGKYNYEDCDIYATIIREAREETYNVVDMTYKMMMNIKNKYEPVYVNGYQRKPVYVCYVVPISEISMDVIDKREFHARRNAALLANPQVPAEYYGSVDLAYITFDDLNRGLYRLSYRLKRILNHGPLSPYVRVDFSKSPVITDDVKLNGKLEKTCSDEDIVE